MSKPQSLSELVESCEKTIKCIECKEDVLPRLYSKHQRQQHKWKREKQHCLWCRALCWGEMGNIHRYICLWHKLNPPKPKKTVTFRDPLVVNKTN